jgi:hypothetical protein
MGRKKTRPIELSFEVKMSQATIPDEPKTSNRTRFETELEFVQALSNPYYLHSLAQQGILNQPAFVNFLEYLQYWKEKDYARFILYATTVLVVTDLPMDLKGTHMHCTI